ncbi:hypothetical protein Franean1_2908 [Parafrankia sp. EAN1pec]|nr:hypothetical protein Franean1_2908 [Frankia sp. EAN1pec]
MIARTARRFQRDEVVVVGDEPTSPHRLDMGLAVLSEVSDGLRSDTLNRPERDPWRVRSGRSAMPGPDLLTLQQVTAVWDEHE